MDFVLYTITKKGILFPQYSILEDDYLIYYVKNSGLFRKNFIFYNEYDEAILRVKSKWVFFKLKYEIYKDGYHYADIIKDKGVFKNNYIIDFDKGEYRIEGNFSMKEFTFFNGFEEIAKLSRKSMVAKRRYGLAVSTSVDQDLIIGSAFAMEIVRQTRKNSG